MSERLKLAIDCDDVIADTTSAVLSHVHTRITPDAPRGNISCDRYWRNRMRMDKRAATEFVHQFELDGYPGLQLVHGAREALKELHRSFELHVVTARMRVVREITEDFLREQGLDQFIEEIHHSKNPFHESDEPTKAMVCRTLGAKALIDDSPGQIAGMVSDGQVGVLFGEQPWQVMPQGIDPSIRIHSWKNRYQLEEFLHAA